MLDNPVNKFDPDSPAAQVCRSQPLGVHTLHASPTNPRKTFDAKAMAELTASVREHGVMQPIIVRFWPTDQRYTGPDLPMYEVVCGERRFRAAREAGLQLIPGIVRDLDTKAVIELQLLENLQREGLHELEEAEGYGVMMKDHGYTAEKLAERIGKSRSYIFARLKLLDLDVAARRLFRKGLLNPSTALLVARIPTTRLRTKAINEITDKDYHGDAMSVRAAKKYIRDRYMLDLAKAPFPIDDPALCGGSCAACKKRSGNLDADLFDDVTSPDVCTDPDCFEAKRTMHIDRVAKAAKEEGKEVITGEAASKASGGYISEHSAEVGKGFVKLDAPCPADPGKRTYRELIGDAVKETLIEHPRTHDLVPVVKNTAVAEALKKAGIESPHEQQQKQSAKVAEKVEAERAVRQRLVETIRSEAAWCSYDGSPAISADKQLVILREIIANLWQRSYDNTKIAFMRTWKIEGRNVTERKEATPAFIRQASLGWCWQMMIDLLIGDATEVSEYSLQWEHEGLKTLIALFEINAGAVRKTVEIERKDAKKATKPAAKAKSADKKAKKPASVTAADPLSPCEAARAEEISGAENKFKVGDLVKIKDVLPDPTVSDAWKKKVAGKSGTIVNTKADLYVVSIDDIQGDDDFYGYELEPAPTEAAQAGDESDEDIIETNETPTGTEPTEGITAAGADAGAEPIEPHEKPKGSQRLPAAYAHPSNPSLTWTGRGRRPAWVAAWIEEGGALEDLRAKEAA